MSLVEHDATEHKVYEPIAEAQNIIGMLVSNIYNDATYQVYLTNLENSNLTDQRKAAIIKKTFTDMQVFNTNRQPLFLARDVGILMGITNISATVKNYNDTEKIIGCVMQNGKQKQKYFLTKHGVYRILFSSRTKLSDVFRGFIYKLLDYMMDYESEKIKSIMSQYALENPEQIRESFIELHENAAKFQVLYEMEKKEREIWAMKAEEEHEKNIILENEIVAVDIQNSFNEMQIEQLSIDKRAFLQKIHNMKDEVFDNQDNKELLDTLKRKYLKEVNLFIATPQYIDKLLTCKKKIQKVSSSVEQYTKDYNMTVFDFQREVDIIEDKDLFYYIVFKKVSEDSDKYTHIATEWVADKSKYIELVDILKNECEAIELQSTKKNGDFIFKTTLEHIRSIANDLLLLE